LNYLRLGYPPKFKLPLYLALTFALNPSLGAHAGSVFDLIPYGATYGLDIYNSRTGTVTQTGNLGFTTGTIAAFGSGTVVSLASFGGTYGLDIYNTKTGVVTHTGDLGWTSGVIAADGTGKIYNLAAFGGTYGLNIYDTKTGAVSSTGNLGFTTGVIAADGSGKVYNLAAFGATYGLDIYDSRTGAVTHTGNLGFTTAAIAADGSGKVYSLASFGATYGLNIYDSKTGTVTHTGNLGWTSGTIVADGSGKVYNLVSFGSSYGLNIYDSRTGTMTQTTDLGFISGIFAANLTPWYSMLGSTQAFGNRSAYGAAAALDTIIASSPNGDIGVVIDTLNALASQNEVNNAISQTLPLLAGSMSLAIRDDLHDIHRIIEARQESLSSGISTGDEFYGDKYFWLKPFGSWASQNDKGGISGFSKNTYGMLLGADKELSDTNRLGIAFGFARSSIDSNSTVAPQNADVNSYLGLIYGSHKLNDATDINFQADIGKHDTSGHRNIIFMDRIASSDYSSWSGHIGIGLAHTIKLTEKTSFTPSVRADYTILREDAYSETGAGALNLNVHRNTTHEMIVGMDGKLTHAVTDRIRVMANLGFGYDVLNNQASVTSAFYGAPDISFTTKGLESSPWLGRGGLGLSSTPNDAVEISARYDFEVRDRFNNQMSSVRVRWIF
jgi:outer membrane autotransporter protein